MTLDRNQAPDAQQPRIGPAVGIRTAVRIDPVVDDLEALAVEAFDLLEIPRQPARDYRLFFFTREL